MYDDDSTIHETTPLQVLVLGLLTLLSWAFVWGGALALACWLLP